MIHNTAALKAKLIELGIQPKKALGQNFLVSESVVQKIIDAVKSMDVREWIEIGPGLGALTERLLDIQNECQIQNLTLLEWDHLFAQIWLEKSLTSSKNLKVIEGDALNWEGWLRIQNPQSTLLISNLPYQISSSIVIDRCLDPFRINGMILMFQKEVAQRILAKPKTESYGLLSVMAQTFWDIRLLLEAGPSDFYPPPQVASRVLVFKNKATDLEAQQALAFFKWVKVGFSQRRKLLKSNLGAITPRAEDLLEKLGFGDKVRAEELTVLDWKRLFKLVTSKNSKD